MGDVGGGAVGEAFSVLMGKGGREGARAERFSE